MKLSEWTNIQKECYDRNCICEGCFFRQYNKRCKVKKTLIATIKKFGLDSGVETKQWLQE